MRLLRQMLGLWTVLALTACVTINVYFPAEAAEKAADRVIEGVWGEDASNVAPEPRSAVDEPGGGLARGVAAVVGWLIPAANAQADLDISSPAVDGIRAAMQARHRELSPLYAQGVVGLTAEGLVAVRDPKAVPLASRQAVNRLVADENRDRNALYREIARANRHPEWEADIRTTFARRWVERAPAGWWYRSGGAWQQR